jgi:hypothetical protein
MTGPARSKKTDAGANAGEVARSAVGKAHIDLTKALTQVFAAGVYTKEKLQNAVCRYVAAMKKDGASVEAVVREAESLMREISGRFPPSGRTQALLTEMVTWCLAEYYRETA